MRNMPFMLLVIFIQLSYPAFLVGEGKIGEKIPVLCESEEQIFVSTPSGSSERMPLDSDFQAAFAPDAPGPYTVQCGNETKVVVVAAAAVPASALQQAEGVVSQGDALLLYAVLVLLLAFAAAAALIAKEILGRTFFVKTVEGDVARLELRAGRKLENVKIEDPVSMGFAGEPLSFSLPLLMPGTAWAYEYGLADPKRALPASLAAEMGGKKVLLLSELHINTKKGDGEPALGNRQHPKTTSRKLPKAA